MIFVRSVSLWIIQILYFIYLTASLGTLFIIDSYWFSLLSADLCPLHSTLHLVIQLLFSFLGGSKHFYTDWHSEKTCFQLPKQLNQINPIRFWASTSISNVFLPSFFLHKSFSVIMPLLWKHNFYSWGLQMVEIWLQN